MKIKAIITGATGMVGEGVLHECLQHPAVESVLVIGRRSCGVKHQKLREIIHTNFYDLAPIEQHLTGYNACFFCLGVSSIGMTEEEFYRPTYTLTMHVAATLSRLNQEMTFCYVSGSGTDSTEKGTVMWARVKGKTENDLMKLPFKNAYNFRPGFMRPTVGLKNTLSFYKYVNWLYPVLRKVFPKHVSTLGEVGLAMIQVAQHGYNHQVLEVTDIVSIAGSRT